MTRKDQASPGVAAQTVAAEAHKASTPEQRISTTPPPFDPSDGQFVRNIRDTTGIDDAELRTSMEQAGWIEHFPAFADENDVVIVGHRRMKIAAELGIEPVIHKLVFGEGEEADAKRLRLATASNIGGQGMSQNDRRRIAEYLYTKQSWTMARIAGALNVGITTVHRDLEGFSSVEKPPRPKGGRPKGSGKPRNEPKPAADDDGEPLIPDRAIIKERMQRAYFIDAVDLMDKMSKATRAKFFDYLEKHWHPATPEEQASSLTRSTQGGGDDGEPRLDVSEIGRLRGEITKLKSDIAKLKMMLAEEPDAAKLRKKVVDQNVELEGRRKAMKALAKERDKLAKQVARYAARYTDEFHAALRLATRKNYAVLVKANHSDRAKHCTAAELAEAERLIIALMPLFQGKDDGEAV
jgi:hypothetical protein